jgi:Ni/Fe-hydrogenase subunit HybB-like protein
MIDLGRWWDFWHIFTPQIRAAELGALRGRHLHHGAYIVDHVDGVHGADGDGALRHGSAPVSASTSSAVLFFVVAIGVLLPTMHQSSLGTLLDRLRATQIDPIYQTRLLPVLFLTSTIGMGLSAVVVEGSVTSLALRRPVERDLLGKLMRVGQVLAAGFLIARFVDLGVRGQLGALTTLRPLVVMFWIETVLFAVPVVLLLGPAGRRPARVFVAAMAMALAGILYRLDAYLVAYDTGAGWRYFPSLGELAVTIGLIAFEILAFIIAIRVLPVLPKLGRSRAAAGTA